MDDYDDMTIPAPNLDIPPEKTLSPPFLALQALQLEKVERIKNSCRRHPPRVREAYLALQSCHYPGGPM